MFEQLFIRPNQTGLLGSAQKVAISVLNLLKPVRTLSLGLYLHRLLDRGCSAASRRGWEDATLDQPLNKLSNLAEACNSCRIL